LFLLLSLPPPKSPSAEEEEVSNINPFTNSALRKLINSCTNGSSTKLSSISKPLAALEPLPYEDDIVCRARIAYLLFCRIVATTLDASALMIAAKDIIALFEDLLLLMMTRIRSSLLSLSLSLFALIIRK
jgi:hypothetical protein